MKKKYLISLIIGIILFMVLTIIVVTNKELAIDYSFFKFINRTNSLYSIMRVLTNFGEWYTYIFIALLIFIFKRKYSYILIACILSNTLFNNALKLLFQRERPIWKSYNPTGYSYPSGHAMSSLAFYGLIIYLLIKYYKGKAKYPIIVILSLLIIVVGLSRIYLGVHYLTDVLGAYFFDLIFLSVFITLSENNKVIKE